MVFPFVGEKAERDYMRLSRVNLLGKQTGCIWYLSWREGGGASLADLRFCTKNHQVSISQNSKRLGFNCAPEVDFDNYQETKV